MTLTLNPQLDRLRYLRDVLGPGGELTERAVADIVAVLSDEHFLSAPLDLQCAFLDLVQPKYLNTWHPTSLELASAMQRVFQAHLRMGQMSLSRLLKTYDCLYFLYWCAAVSIRQQQGFDTDVAAPFSRRLARRAQLNTLHRPSMAALENQKTRLCYLAQFAYSGSGNSLGLVAETLMDGLSRHYSGAYELFLYAWMHKDQRFLRRFNSIGVHVRTFDLSDYSEDELQRLTQSFADDRIDAVITDMNSAVPHYLFESRVAPVQIFYQLGLPYWRLQNLDAVFQGWQIPPETLGFSAERCHAVPAPLSFRNINPPIAAKRIRVERARFPRSRRIVGFYGRLVKITPVYCNILLRILEKNPGTIVALGGTGNATAIQDFIREARLQDRVFVVNELVEGQVWGHLLDVFLDTFPLAGGYSCREVMAKGKPIVHMISEEMPNLTTFLDPALRAGTAEDYVALVSRLLTDSSFYREACASAAGIAEEHSDTRPFADNLHAALQKVLCVN